jgi:WD40 repeat protein
VTADFVGSDSKLYFPRDEMLYQYDRASQMVSGVHLSGHLNMGLSLRELTFDNQNNLYIANFSEGTAGLVKIAQDGTSVTNFFAKPADARYWGVTYGNDNYLYATEPNANAIRKIGLDGALVASFSDIRLNSPRGLAFDTKGNLLIANSGSRNLLIYDAGFNYLGELPLTSEVWGVAVRPNGAIYVSSGNQGDFINVYDDNYQIIARITHADLTEPAQMAFDDAGFLHSSSTNRPNIVVFDTANSHFLTIDLFDSSLGMAFDRHTADSFVLPASRVLPEPNGLVAWSIMGPAGLSIRLRRKARRPKAQTACVAGRFAT